jgi:hypothetical protein
VGCWVALGMGGWLSAFALAITCSWRPFALRAERRYCVMHAFRAGSPSWTVHATSGVCVARLGIAREREPYMEVWSVQGVCVLLLAHRVSLPWGAGPTAVGCAPSLAHPRSTRGRAARLIVCALCVPQCQFRATCVTLCSKLWLCACILWQVVRECCSQPHLTVAFIQAGHVASGCLICICCWLRWLWRGGG